MFCFYRNKDNEVVACLALKAKKDYIGVQDGLPHSRTFQFNTIQYEAYRYMDAISFGCRNFGDL